MFFLGIGGIGMSGLARYFHSLGLPIMGYDRTPSALTREMESEGMEISYEDSAEWLRGLGIRPTDTLVVRTPAVPDDTAVYVCLREAGFDIHKRAEVLGLVTREKKALCVAGTHGKTTTSTMIAHLLNDQREDVQSTKGVSAFLGGVSMNYGTNVLIDKESEYVVVEADEYDRSFHHLRPYISVVTAIDADHLDIYGTAEAYRESFAHYTSLITHALVMKHGIALQPRLQEGVRCYTYDVRSDEVQRTKELPDFYADNIRVCEGSVVFDFNTPDGVITDISLGVPVWVNIENAVAAMAVAWLVDERGSAFAERLRARMASFKGVLRRFNIHVNTPRVAYIDDYAHHPQEILTAIDSIRKVYPTRRLIGVFQPHLYTRTRDFADGFARVLSTLDECILLPIYPAREEPIAGVSSEMLMERMPDGKAQVVQKSELTAEIGKRIAKSSEPVVVLTVGAGDIDRLVPDVTEKCEESAQ